MIWLVLIVIGVGFVLTGIAVYLLNYPGAKSGLPPEEHAEQVRRKYDPELSPAEAEDVWIASTARTGVAHQLATEIESNTKLTESRRLNEEEQAKLATVEQSINRQRERDEAQHQKSIVQLAAETSLIQLAASENMDLATYLVVQQARYMKDVDLQARVVEYQQDHDAIDRIELTQHELIDKLTHRLFEMYEAKAILEQGNDIAKDAKLARLEKNIGVVEELINVRQSRLIQAEAPQEGQRRLPQDNRRADYPSEADEDNQ